MSVVVASEAGGNREQNEAYIMYAGPFDIVKNIKSDLHSIDDSQKIT